MKSFLIILCILVVVYTTLGNDTDSLHHEKSYGCLCSNYTCGCCAHIESPKVGLNDTGCVNLTYLTQDYGISFTVTIDNLTIYNETISAKNPPPACFGAPVLKDYADLCLRFYDLDVSRTKLHGCVKIEARLHHVTVGEYKIGCFNLGQSRWKIYHKKLIHIIRLRNKDLKLSNHNDKIVDFNF